MDAPPEGRGWTDIGYHFFIRKDGTVENGRDLERTPAAQKGFNTGSIAICLSGLELELFTEAQLDALKALCQEIDDLYDNISFHGHNEVNPHKICPVISVKQVLGLDDYGEMV